MEVKSMISIKKMIPAICAGMLFVFFTGITIASGDDVATLQELLPISEAEGDGIHITQIIDATYNPTGPYSSANCGPASFAMCLRALGYFGYGNTSRLNPEEQIDHARALLYPTHYQVYTITKEGIPYTMLNRDSDYSDVGTYGPPAISTLGGGAMTVSSQATLDKALENGMPIVLFGYLDTEWRSQFTPQGHWSGTCPHYIAVTGKTGDGYYIVNDPMYYYGGDLMTYTQLSKFPQSGNYVSGTAFHWKTPTPFAIKKSDGIVNVFMRDISSGRIYRTYQTSQNGGFANWSYISSLAVGGNPVAIEQPNGRLLLFVKGASNQVIMFSEDAYGNMSSYTDFGGETYYAVSASKNLDGRVEFFVRGIDGNIYKRYQTSVNGGFSDWCSLDGDTRSAPEAVQNADGRMEVFVGWKYTAAAQTPLAHTWQTSANGDWSGTWNYSDLGGHIKGHPKAFLHGMDSTTGDGWLRAFVRSGTDNVLYYKTQRDSWNSWYTAGSLPKAVFGHPAVSMITYKDTDNYYYDDMQVFVRGVDNVTYWSRLKKRGSSYSWTSWSGNIDGIATSDPGCARFANGRIFVTVRGNDGNLYYRVQSNDQGDWAAWAYLGNSLDFR